MFFVVSLGIRLGLVGDTERRASQPGLWAYIMQRLFFFFFVCFDMPSLCVGVPESYKANIVLF